MTTSNKTDVDIAKDNQGVTFSDIHSDELHEDVLAEATDSIVKGKSQSPSASKVPKKFNVGAALGKENVQDGIFVTDKKRHHVSFGKNLRSAFNEWFTGTKERIGEIQEQFTKEDLEEPEPKIAKVETRKNIVEKAITHGAIAPHDDSEFVIEKIRTYKRDVAKARGGELIIKEPVLQKSSWTHTVKPEEKAVVKTEAATPTSSPKKHIAPPDMRSTMVAPLVHQRSTSMVRPSQDKGTSPIPTPSPEVPEMNTVPIHAKKIEEMDERTNPIYVAPEVTVRAKVTMPDERSVARAHASPPPNLPTSDEAPEETRTIAEPIKPVSHSDVEKALPPVSKIPDTNISESVAIETLDATQTQPIEPSIAPVPQSRPEFHSNPLPDITRQELKVAQEAREKIVSQPTKSGLSTSTVRIYLIRGAVALILALLCAALLFFFLLRTPAQNTEMEQAPAVTSMHETQSANTILLTGTSQEFREMLSTKIKSADAGVVEIYPTHTETDVSQPVTTEELLNFLQIKLPTNVQRSLDESFVIGSVSTSRNEPFIILYSNNFDLLFTGMLAWEKDMYVDLFPLFGSDTSLTTIFKDAIRENSSTRIATNGEGAEALLYSFTTKNSVIITTSSEALSLLVSEY